MASDKQKVARLVHTIILIPVYVNTNSLRSVRAKGLIDFYVSNVGLICYAQIPF